MPIKIPNDLPASKTLTNEHIFVMNEEMAFHQDIRPLQILILNLMPTKIVTETQLLRLLSNSPLQVEVTFLQPASYVSTHTPASHMAQFYRVFDDVKDKKFDGMIITGAPVEMLEFEEVSYWEELCKIMEWTKDNVTSTFHICWGAQAGLYYHYGISKKTLPKKLFGIYSHQNTRKQTRLFRGFDDVFYAPYSRYTESPLEEVLAKKNVLDVLAVSEDAGLSICASYDRRQIFVSGHFEYDRETLKTEYERDIKKGLDIDVPEHYFPNDDPNEKPVFIWKSAANLLYSNWLNYYVYQVTPYDISEINRDFVPEKKGSVDEND
ncbi:MAG: homoserine O-succinyltransferase [Clostridia bacterium]|nr:homoserine O-succinyltransferase [Clostridia bacterium]